MSTKTYEQTHHFMPGSNPGNIYWKIFHDSIVHCGEWEVGRWSGYKGVDKAIEVVKYSLDITEHKSSDIGFLLEDEEGEISNRGIFLHLANHARENSLTTNSEHNDFLKTLLTTLRIKKAKNLEFTLSKEEIKLRDVFIDRLANPPKRKSEYF